MSIDSQLIKDRHKNFIKTVCETEKVYGLENADGFAFTSSAHYENEDGEPIGIICFWGDKALAQSCIQNSWSECQVLEMSLSNFMEHWCIGMDKDGLLVGTEFDENIFGYESEPFTLILQLTAELKNQGKDLKFENFGGIADLEKQIKEIFD